MSVARHPALHGFTRWVRHAHRCSLDVREEGRCRADEASHGTASGWGGLPESEAYYYIDAEPRAAGRYTFTFEDVPVDAFWSVTIFNRDGYFEANRYDVHSRNGVTSHADERGTVTLNLVPDDQRLDNYLFVMDGWNYNIRRCKPRQAVFDKSWTPPAPVRCAERERSGRRRTRCRVQLLAWASIEAEAIVHSAILWG